MENPELEILNDEALKRLEKKAEKEEKEGKKGFQLGPGNNFLFPH